MNKTIVNCKLCRHKLRIPKYKRIEFKCPKCSCIMNYNGKSKKYKLYGVLALIIILIAYFTFFNDYFKYLEVKDKRYEHICKQYYLEYPNGYFTEEVKVIEIEITKDINLIRNFFAILWKYLLIDLFVPIFGFCKNSARPGGFSILKSLHFS